MSRMIVVGATLALAHRDRVRETRHTPLPVAGAQSFGSANEAMARNFASDVRSGLVLPGVGHFAAEERAAEVSEAVRAFLA